MALSGIHITCAYSGSNPFSPSAPPILSKIVWSETIASGDTAALTAPGANAQYGPVIFEVYASVDCFVSYGPPADLDAAALSVFIPAEQTYDFIAQPGDGILWDEA